MGPKVAIAMAVYNDSRYLGYSLEALCAQTFRDFHLTVLDDGSTDGSAAIAEAYSGKLSMVVYRAPHRGRHAAKQESWRLAAPAPYLMVLDSDMALSPDALARMARLLDEVPQAAAVFAQQRSDVSRPLGAAQAFLEDLFTRSNSDGQGNSRYIQGGSVMFRRSALEAATVTGRMGEDNELTQQLARGWRILNPPDLVATHYGVPTTIGGVARRAYREGIRVRSLLRAYPEAWQLANVARLVPPNLLAIAVIGLVTGQAWLSGASGALLAAYLGAFIWVSRAVPARPLDRTVGAALFAFGNVAYAAGFLRATLRGGGSQQMSEPNRAF